MTSTGDCGIRGLVSGKNQILRIERINRSLPEVAVGSYSLQAGVTTVFCAKTNVKDFERSMEFIGFYIFKCHHGESIKL